MQWKGEKARKMLKWVQFTLLMLGLVLALVLTVQCPVFYFLNLFFPIRDVWPLLLGSLCKLSLGSRQDAPDNLVHLHLLVQALPLGAPLISS
jgi:hypothetical protein